MQDIVQSAMASLVCRDRSWDGRKQVPMAEVSRKHPISSKLRSIRAAPRYLSSPALAEEKAHLRICSERRAKNHAAVVHCHTDRDARKE